MFRAPVHQGWVWGFGLAFLLLAGPQACDQMASGGSSGKALWKRHCAECHGLNGAGKVPKYRRYEYSNLMDDDWMESGSDESVAQAIRGGVGLLMPANETLTDREVELLLEYLRELRGGR